MAEDRILNPQVPGKYSPLETLAMSALRRFGDFHPSQFLAFGGRLLSLDEGKPLNSCPCDSQSRECLLQLLWKAAALRPRSPVLSSAPVFARAPWYRRVLMISICEHSN